MLATSTKCPFVYSSKITRIESPTINPSILTSKLFCEKLAKETSEFYLELSKIQFEIRNANIQRDSMVVDDLNDQFEAMKTKLSDYELNFIKVNNDSYLSSLILQRNQN